MTQLFTVNHLIWLGVCGVVVLVLFLLFLLAKWKVDTCMNIALVSLFAMEAVRLSASVEYVDGDLFYNGSTNSNVGMIFLVLLLIAKLSKKVSLQRRVLFPVLAVFGIFSSIGEVLLPTFTPVFVAENYATTVYPYTFFLSNAMTFVIAVRLAADRDIEWSGKTYVHTLACMAVLVLFAINVNVIFGSNLLYTIKPSIYLESVLSFGNEPVYLIYIGEYIACAFVLTTLFMTPFMIARAARIENNKFSNKFTIELPEEEEADDETYSPATISSILASDEE